MKFKLSILFLAVFMVGCGDEYMKADAKYQCFVGGEQVYKSNVKPATRGGNWFLLDGEVRQVDDCFCMGCIGF